MASVWTQRVNSILSMILVGSFGLGATLVLLNVAGAGNPIAEAMEARMIALE